MRLKITIAYDGRGFSGWATQPSGHTIQDLIQSAIEQVSKQKVQIQGSGRTDTGVHADGQIAHFDKPEGIDMNPYNWVPALNTKLPATIRVLDCEEVSEDFHARFSAKSKTYSYLLAMQPVLHPMLSGRSWHLPRQLDKATLAEAMSHYIGTHDFRAFAALRGNESEDTCYKRTITEASVKEIDEGFILTYTGSGFLYKMVRLLTGAAVYAAQGKLRLDDHLALLDQSGDQPSGRSPYCAPSDGLTLTRVEY
ncbi:tRNA pseudouridine(38-40) synthase TruA [Rubritalea sp.]|uniref:tRNA pseudouridine(38-40) synthase TruA n=1 Tax=Rubritalea sp. TaxID=2109375 RepID=UPI003EF9166F